MNEPAIPEQEYPPPLAERIDTMLDTKADKIISKGEVYALKNYIDLLRVRVKKGENRKRAYATLNQSHLMTLLELRWLRAMVRGGDPVNWAMVLEQAKGSLWAIFRKEQAQDKNSPQAQINKLANFIMAQVPGEPFKSEGAVDTAIRVLKEFRSMIVTDNLSGDEITTKEIRLTDKAGDVPFFIGTWKQLKSKVLAANHTNRGI